MLFIVLKRILNEIFRVPLSLLFYRIVSYPFPIRSAIIRIFTIIFKYYRPHYYSILYDSVISAKELGYKRISCIEFGVANGNGIISLEKYSKILTKKFNIDIDIYGFDIGKSGLPSPKDYRDLPHIWKKGFYAMKEEELKKKLNFANLILGDVNKTVPNFCTKHKLSPIACIFFDLDFYSSTNNALKIFNSNHKFFLPRILCYFDDVQKYVNKYNGPLLAINEFNNTHKEQKILQDHGKMLNYSYGCHLESIFTYHYFNHPKYKEYLNLSVGNLE